MTMGFCHWSPIWYEQRGGDSTKHNGKLNLWLVFSGMCVCVWEGGGYCIWFLLFCLSSSFDCLLSDCFPLLPWNAHFAPARLHVHLNSPLWPVGISVSIFSLSVPDYMNISLTSVRASISVFVELYKRHVEWHMCIFRAFLFSVFLDWFHYILCQLVFSVVASTARRLPYMVSSVRDFFCSSSSRLFSVQLYNSAWIPYTYV